MTSKPKCEVINQYFERIVSCFLNEKYLIRAKVVHIASDNLHHLAKVCQRILLKVAHIFQIPALAHNFKIECFEDLKDVVKYPSTISFFCVDKITEIGKPFFVCALEMADATRIPCQLSFVYGPTITVELKPKQGFFQKHPDVDVPFCNNCILQVCKFCCL